MSRSKRPRGVAAEPMSARQVREILQDLARWAVASSVGLAGGCSSVHELADMSQDVPEAGGGAGTGFPVSHAGRERPRAGTGMTEPPIEKPTPPRAGTNAPPVGGARPPTAGGVAPLPPQWEPLPCSMAGTFESVKLAQPVDYFAIYRSYPGGIGQTGENYPPTAHAVASIGQPCSAAAMRAGCETALMSLGVPNADCKAEASCTSFFLTNTGDEVTRSESRAALIALLGPIDTAEKAILVAVYDEALGSHGGVTCFYRQSGLGIETRPTDGGFEIRNTWDECSGGVYTKVVTVGKDGTVTPGEMTQVRNSTCSVGRRPAGLQPAAYLAARTQLGAFLADAARLEAASVFAFERLARELVTLGAPQALIAVAARSALEEIRHAELVTRLALRFGGAPAAVELAPLPARSLFAIALENAVEGCVRETYGALLAEHQAQTAQDPEVRAVMAQIATDELQHALLAWQVAAFLEPRLMPAERDQLALARATAIAQLLTEDVELSTQARAAIGWPEQRLAVQLVERLAAGLRVA